jgi:hypothetical protein
MELLLTVAALLGLIIFVVGGALYLGRRPDTARNATIMVIGGLVFAVATAIGLLIALF